VLKPPAEVAVRRSPIGAAVVKVGRSSATDLGPRLVTQDDRTTPTITGQQAYLQAADKLRVLASYFASSEAREQLAQLASCYGKLAELAAKHAHSPLG
jgi:hypothetical protein